MSSPIKIKKGTGRRVKVVMELKIPVAVVISPGSPPRKNQAAAIFTIKKAKATGSPVSKKTTIPPKRIRMIAHHSTAGYSLLVLM
jgi:hypothetical protein